MISQKKKRRSTMDPFDRIIGYEAQKDELRRISAILKDPCRYRDRGIRPPKALMLYGEPGLGKTSMARALIEESGRKSFACRKSRSDRDFTTEIKTTFEDAAASSPSIVFLDDVDKYAEDNLREDSNKEEFAIIQSCMEDVRDRDVFVLATANNIEIIPESLMRPGRFGRRMLIDEPIYRDAVAITENYLRSFGASDGPDPEFVVQLIGRPFSGAKLEEVINEAAIRANYRGAAAIRRDDIVEAVFGIVHCTQAGDTGSGAGRTPGELNTVAYHEAGHAVMRLAVGGTVPLISTIGTGIIKGFCCSFEGDGGKTFEQLMNDVRVSLAGKAAVETLLGIKDIGTEKDIESAAEIIRRCTEKTFSFGFEFGNDLHPWDRRLSETRKAAVTDKVCSLLEKYYGETCSVIRAHSGFVRAVAEELKNRKYLCSDDLERIRRTAEPTDGSCA
jgi:cell division protease FtsH